MPIPAYDDSALAVGQGNLPGVENEKDFALVYNICNSFFLVVKMLALEWKTQQDKESTRMTFGLSFSFSPSKKKARVNHF